MAWEIDYFGRLLWKIYVILWFTLFCGAPTPAGVGALGTSRCFQAVGDQIKDVEASHTTLVRHRIYPLGGGFDIFSVRTTRVNWLFAMKYST